MPSNAYFNNGVPAPAFRCLKRLVSKYGKELGIKKGAAFTYSILLWLFTLGGCYLLWEYWSIWQAGEYFEFSSWKLILLNELPAGLMFALFLSLVIFLMFEAIVITNKYRKLKKHRGGVVPKF